MGSTSQNVYNAKPICLPRSFLKPSLPQIELEVPFSSSNKSYCTGRTKFLYLALIAYEKARLPLCPPYLYFNGFCDCKILNCTVTCRTLENVSATASI